MPRRRAFDLAHGVPLVVRIRQFGCGTELIFCIFGIDMRMADPIPTFSYVVEQIVAKHPNVAFIHLVEPRVNGVTDRIVEAGEVRNN